MNMRQQTAVDDNFDRLFIDHPLYELNPQSFCLEIEKAVRELQLDYLEAATHVCEKYEIDFTDVPNLITESMKDKIEMDSESKNRFRKAKRPVVENVDAAEEFFMSIEEASEEDEDE
jgi:hypothetical protein